jgi:hypothetical protein
MEEHRIEQWNPPNVDKLIIPNFTRPVWKNQQMTCEHCRFSDQDIDTFPCAKCHTRN